MASIASGSGAGWAMNFGSVAVSPTVDGWAKLDLAELGDRAVDGSADRRVVRDVGLEPGRPPAELLGERGERAGLQPHERHVGVGGVQPPRGGGADAARRPGDEDRPPGDVVARAQHHATGAGAGALTSAARRRV